jgi:hypothetical protein
MSYPPPASMWGAADWSPPSLPAEEPILGMFPPEPIVKQLPKRKTHKKNGGKKYKTKRSKKTIRRRRKHA